MQQAVGREGGGHQLGPQCQPGRGGVSGWVVGGAGQCQGGGVAGWC